MAQFGPHSLAQRETLHVDLRKVLDAGILVMDFQIVEGFRGKMLQNIAWAKGNSTKPWPLSNHNKWPALSADVAPWPIDWSDKRKALERFVYLQGILWQAAADVGVRVRQGIDWNRNQDMRDNVGLHDYPHIELYLPRALTFAEMQTYSPMPA